MTLAPTDYDYGDAANYSFAMEITCANDEARAMFVEAFGHMLNYNHEQAIACFSKVTELDDTCAMAWWGIAYCVSSNYNWAPGLGSGHDSIQQAVSLKDGCTELEQDLIDALATRHSAEARDAADPTVLNMGNSPELNVAFAEAMAPLYEKYSGNLDVTAIYVEALMNLKAWQLWDKNTATGEITPADDNTLLLVKILEDAFESSEEAKINPALCHLYCHALELSPFPEKALPAADVLRNLMPGLGHLVHMPSHIDAWVGQWKEAVECNIAAVEADDRYVELTGNESQKDNQRVKCVLNWYASNPTKVIKLFYNKTLYFWSPWFGPEANGTMARNPWLTISPIKNIASTPDGANLVYGGFGKLISWFWLLGGLGLLLYGFLILWRQNSLERFVGNIAMIAISTNWLISLISIGDHRFRIPIMGMSLFLQAVGLRTLFKGGKAPMVEGPALR